MIASSTKVWEYTMYILSVSLNKDTIDVSFYTSLKKLHA